MLHDFSSPSHLSRPVHVSLLLLVCSIREPDTSRSNHPTSSVVHMSKDEKERRRTNRSHHLIITNHH
ncbi:LOW QUALITY PROTEIN: hypothetical protein YC2023_098878 [Brassica napus]